MTNIHRGLCWAAAIVFTAIARRYGVFDIEAADTLLLVLPLVAILSLRNGRECSMAGKKRV
jgi:hypothetical protein